MTLAAALLAAAGCASPPRAGVREHFNFWPLARYETSAEPPGYVLDVLWPIVRFEARGAGRHARVLPFFRSDDDGAEHELRLLDLFLVSLYSDAARADGAYARRFLGLLDPFEHDALALAASYGDASGSHRHVFPVWFDTRDTSGRTRSWFAGPLLGLESDPARELESVDVLFPLFRWQHVGEGATATWRVRALPVGWLTRRSDSTIHFASPLYVHTTDRQSLLVRDEFLWPLTRFESTRDGTRSWLFPLWYHRTSGAREHWNLLGVLDTESSEVRDAWLLWPLYAGDGSFGEGERSSWLPLVDLRHAFGPSPRGDETAVLFPLASFRRDGIESASRIFPFWWAHDDGLIESSTWLWPLYGSSRRGSSRDVSVLWPIFRWEWTAADGNVEEFSILGALYWSRVERDRSARSVPFLFGYRRDRNAHELKLLHWIPIRW